MLTSSLSPSLSPCPKPQTGHCGPKGRFSCGWTHTPPPLSHSSVPSVTTRPGLLLPPVSTVSSWRSPSSTPAPQGPHKPPQSEAFLRPTPAQGWALMQPLLFPWGSARQPPTEAPNHCNHRSRAKAKQAHSSPTTGKEEFHATNLVHSLGSSSAPQKSKQNG